MKSLKIAISALFFLGLAAHAEGEPSQPSQPVPVADAKPTEVKHENHDTVANKPTHHKKPTTAKKNTTKPVQKTETAPSNPGH